MSRLTVFAKGNVDVHDTLVVAREGTGVVWNGVNEILRTRARPREPAARIRVRHETCSRLDAVLASTGIPAELRVKAPPLQNYPLASQFETALFEPGHDVVVLSIQPDLANRSHLLRHRRDGYLFLPEGWTTWSDDLRRWLRAEFEPALPPTAAESMATLADVVGRVRAVSGARVVVYNVSFCVPGESLGGSAGDGESLSTRIRLFNAALCELSGRLDVPIVDVDAVVAMHGASRLKYDAFHLRPEALPLVAAEFVHVLEGLGLL